MTLQDRMPLANTPISATLRLNCNNRYGAVLSALHGFWLSRESATARQDAYSVVTFHSMATVFMLNLAKYVRPLSVLQTRVSNDFTSTADQLVGRLIPQNSGGTNFTAALAHAQALIRSNWATDK